MSSLASLLNNESLPKRLAIEAIALVALGVRPMSLVFLPAELPQGEELGRKIDSTYQRSLLEGQHGTMLQRFYAWLQSAGKSPVEYKKMLLHRAYEDIVPRQASYKILISVIEALELPYLLYEVRPSIRELYVCSSHLVKQKLDDLMLERDEIKRAAWAKATPDTPYALLVYPEEQNPSYLKKLGELLGYPSCCIEAYLNDRAQGQNVENRSAYYLLELQQNSQEVDPLAFFLKDFFPCNPQCPEALAKGRQCYDKLAQVDRKLADAFKDMTAQNKQRVTEYPAIISAHLDNLKDHQTKS